MLDNFFSGAAAAKWKRKMRKMFKISFTRVTRQQMSLRAAMNGRVTTQFTSQHTRPAKIRKFFSTGETRKITTYTESILGCGPFLPEIILI